MLNLNLVSLHGRCKTGTERVTERSLPSCFSGYNCYLLPFNICHVALKLVYKLRLLCQKLGKDKYFKGTCVSQIFCYLLDGTSQAVTSKQ